MLKNKRAIIFDLDGVLADTEALHMRAEKVAFTNLGLTITDDELHKFEGRPVIDIATYAVEKYKLDLSPQTFVDQKTKIYLLLAENHLKQIPGATEYVKNARKHFSQVGLVTSSSKFVQGYIFNILNLHSYFDDVVTEDDTRNTKPHPEPYLLIAKKLSISPDDGFVVEDSLSGVASARAAGFTVVGITTSHSEKELRDAGAGYVIRTFDELTKISL